MKRTLTASLIVGLFFVAGFVGCNTAKDESKPAAGTASTAAATATETTSAASDDSKKMQGDWTLVSGEADGTPLPEDEVKNSTLNITGDAYTVTLKGEGVKKGTQKLDETTTPKQIDAHDASGPTVGHNLGIYEFTADGDFRVCFGAPGKDRPTEFSTKPGTGHFMHLWRKAAK